MVGRFLIFCAIFSFGLIAGAEATPRDDMLAGISRCTVFADEKTFLDCVYGAAQPVRDELGLPPAPQSQTRLVPSSSGPMAAPKPFTPPSVARQQQGGFLSNVFGSRKVETQSPMTAYRFDRNGLFTVTLQNGQVWRQLDGLPARWLKPAATYVVTVRAGALGSSNLEVKGETGLYKVERIK